MGHERLECLWWGRMRAKVEPAHAILMIIMQMRGTCTARATFSPQSPNGKTLFCFVALTL